VSAGGFMPDGGGVSAGGFMPDGRACPGGRSA